MKISDVIHKLNEQSITLTAIAKDIGVSRDTLRRRLNIVGYKLDKGTKKYEYTGELNEKDEIDETEISEVYQKNTVKKSDKNQKKIRKTNDKNSDVDLEKSDVALTKSEIFFVKELFKNESDIRLSIDFSMLPPKEKSKKHQMEISEQTFNDFEDFAKKMKEKRYTKNDLLEIALVRLMREFR